MALGGRVAEGKIFQKITTGNFPFQQALPPCVYLLFTCIALYRFVDFRGGG
jgi:hypothetical protein